MNIDKLVGALDSFMLDVSGKAMESPSCVSYGISDPEFQRALGEVAYANAIIPKIQLLKNIVSETEGYKELKRSYKGSDGTVLEEYLVGNGDSSSVVVYLDYTENKNSFNVLLKQLMETGA